MDQEKRQLRILKREIKRAGNKRRRQHLKRDLAERPDEAPYSAYEFRRDSSEGLNGIDRDATRRQTPRNAEEPEPDRDA
jgi:hypothetical protein